MYQQYIKFLENNYQKEQIIMGTWGFSITLGVIYKWSPCRQTDGDQTINCPKSPAVALTWIIPQDFTDLMILRCGAPLIGQGTKFKDVVWGSHILKHAFHLCSLSVNKPVKHKRSQEQGIITYVKGTNGGTNDKVLCIMSHTKMLQWSRPSTSAEAISLFLMQILIAMKHLY